MHHVPLARLLTLSVHHRYDALFALLGRKPRSVTEALGERFRAFMNPPLLSATDAAAASMSSASPVAWQTPTTPATPARLSGTDIARVGIWSPPSGHSGLGWAVSLRPVSFLSRSCLVQLIGMPANTDELLSQGMGG
jgi:hypothetical protein